MKSSSKLLRKVSFKIFLFRVYEIIELADYNDRNSNIYDIFMMGTILLSLLPLLFKHTIPAFDIIEIVTTIVFMLDYLMRLLTANYKLRKGALSFLLYPFTFMAIIDLLAILPSFGMLPWGLRPLKVFRLLRTFKVLKVFKAFKALRYSKSIDIIAKVISEQKTPLIAVGTLALGYILISALVIFNIEPETFDNFFEAIYWATISLTTMGYGNIYPVTTAGRIITIVSSMIGIAIVALPSSIITAGYMEIISKQNSNKEP